LTASWLAQAIQTATTDGAMRARAADLGTALRAEHGVEVAVAEIEAIVAGYPQTGPGGRR
jgi:UDP:flavonoid glycosyltransferase YjiC (YdhE family)